MKADLVIRGACPSAAIARRLWAGGVYVPDAVQLIDAWQDDLERAWRECDRLELVLPLALLRGARTDDVAGCARAWLLDLRDVLAGTQSGEHLASELRGDLLAQLDAPDLDKHELQRRKLALLQRAGQVGHHVRTALAYLVSLHVQRLSIRSATAMHDAHLVGVHCLGAIDGELGPATGQLELGVAGVVDREGFVRRSLARARGLVDRDLKPDNAQETSAA